MFISSLGVYLPKRKITLTQDFLKKKEHFEDEKTASFYKADPSESHLSLAVSAAQEAIKNARCDPEKIDAVFYAEAFIKDYQVWSLSAALCDALGIPRKMHLDVFLGCNGVAALQTAMHLFGSQPDAKKILVTASSYLPSRLGKHEFVDRGGILSDAGTAILLDSQAGAYEIVAIRTDYDGSLSHFIKLPYGGSEALKTSDRIEPWSIADQKDSFLEAYADTSKKISARRRENVTTFLKEQHIRSTDVSYLILPNYCRLYNKYILETFSHLTLEKTSVNVGMQHSHMGAADVFVNLQAMSPQFRPGDLIFVNQDGVGFSFSSMLLRKT